MFKPKVKSIHQKLRGKRRPPSTGSSVMDIVGKGVSLFKSSKYEIVKYQPSTYEEITDIADQLKNGSSVIVNLNLIDEKRFYRCIDFLSGALYVLGGSIEKIAGKNAKIYLITPKTIEVNKEYKDTIASLDINSL